MEAGAIHSALRPAWGRISRGLEQLGSAVLDLCFPKRCTGCQSIWLSAAQGNWCPECRQRLPWIESPLCPRCGCPFIDSPTAPDHLCGECLLEVFPFDSARSAVLHEGVVRDRIHQVKFGGQLYWVPALVELLVLTLQRHPAGAVDALIPVPLHRRRLRQRGFNQAGLIAAALGKRLGVPVHFNVLLRPLWTQPQTRLNRHQRLSNVKGAFQVADPVAVDGRRIMLIDDVFTTGTTLSECAGTLGAAGAAAVYAMTVSRAVPQGVGHD